MNFLSQIIDYQDFAIYVSLMIIIFGLYCFYGLFINLLSINSQIAKMIKLIKTTTDEIEFKEKYEQINELFLKTTILSHLWYEFSEGLLITNKKIKHTNRTTNYFNTNTLLYGHINFLFYKSIPNILTGFGILGTFVGLILCIAQIEINSIEILLNGASIAFSTSIAGLFISIIFIICEKILFFKFDTKIQTLVECLDARLEWISPVKMAYESFYQNERQSIILEKLSDKLGLGVVDVMENTDNKQLQFLEKINNNIICEFQKFEHSLQNQKDIVDNNNKIMTNMIIDVNNIIMECFQNQKDIIENNGKIIIKDVNNKQLQSLKKINNNITEYFQKFEHGFQNQKDIIENNSKTIIRDVNNKQLESLKKINNNITEKFNQFEHDLQNFQKDIIGNNSKTLVNALDIIIHNFNIQMKKQFKNNFKRLNETIDTTTIINKKSLDPILDTITDIENNLSVIPAHLSKLSINVKDIETYLINMKENNVEPKDFLYPIKNLGNEAKTVLPLISQHIDFMTENIGQNNQTMSDTVSEVIGKISKLTGQHTKQINKTTEQVSSNLETFSTETLSKLSDKLNSILDNIEQGTTTAEDAIKSITTQILNLIDEHSKRVDKTTIQIETNLEKFLTDLSNELNSILKYINQASQTLTDTVEGVTTLDLSNELNSILKYIDQSSQIVTTIVEGITTQLLKLTDEHSKQVDRTTEQIETNLEKLLTKTLLNLNNELNSILKYINQGSQAITDTVEGVTKKILNLTDEHSKQANRTTEQIETSLENVLNKTLKILNGDLVTLSEKFVADYLPLTEKLQKVVSIAERSEEKLDYYLSLEEI